MPTRRAALGAIAAAGTLALPRLAHAAWPGERPIEVIVPYPPGGGVDTMLRFDSDGIEDNRLQSRIEFRLA